MGIPYVETTAKEGQGVDEVFEFLMPRALEAVPPGEDMYPAAPPPAMVQNRDCLS